MAVHVRLERGDGVDLDDGDAAAGAAGRAREALPDPAVADDAELAPGEGEVREPVDRGERRLAGAVAVVEEVLAEGVVRGDRREGRACPPPPSPAAARRRSSSPRSRREVRRRPRAGARRSAPSALRRRRRRSPAGCRRPRAGRRRTARARRRASRAPRSRARRARRRSRPVSSRGSSRRRPPLRPRPRAASRGTRSSPRGARRRRRASRGARRRRAARAPARFRTGECFATHWIRCSPSGASDGSAMLERAAASTPRIYPSNRLLPGRLRRRADSLRSAR